MPSRIAATAADMPLFYQSFNSYAQAIAVKTAAHGLRVSLLPEIWVLARSYLLILEGDHFSAAATASPLLPLLSLIPRSSAASRRRRTVGLAGATIGRPSSSEPRARI